MPANPLLHRSPRRCGGSASVVDLGLFVFGLALLATFFLPRHTVRRIVEREARISAEILTLAKHIESLRADVAQDADGDGVGEYPPLATSLAGYGVPFTAVEGTDSYRFGGYYFALFLPDRRYQAVPAASPQVLVDAAEAACMLIAWPVIPGETGMRAFCWTPMDGLLKHAVDGYPYGGADQAPLPRANPVERLSGKLRPARVQDDRWVHQQ